ncbi:centrosomal protein of 68 kDa isoform X2 [Hirundo rustica]|nr:centrosomal protein of 68 kDa isoform X2 [Hirundo rustica]XP_039916043.1 centrosomal protein of 68 kDa isoform X2 [Hirundo rustica]XP_039916044.1 centrosomal protein of 68 kDa isoform X2 [Hirundo rustica]XP_039916046.1 centrosomal protein of 68 kDa isoform X2 [Hirundo rustica]
MAVDVGKSPSEESLSGKAGGDGRWDTADTETEFPELAGSRHRLLGTEGAKPSLQGTESVAVSRHSHTATGVTQGGSGCRPEVSPAAAPGFPRARANPSGKEVLVERAPDGHGVGHCFLSSEQQVKALGSWHPLSSPPSWCSSAEENILAGSRHDAHVGRRRQSPGTSTPCPSTPELLRPQTPPSPERAPRSRSVRSLSAPSSEGNGPSEEPSGSLPGSTDVPSAATTAAQELCCRWGAEGRALQRLEPPGSLLGYRGTVGRVREISSYQADYWACAIPDSLPPSPDRSSPRWNPNKEYEELLDYAYPLKPRYKLGRMPEPFLHDSGIDLDSFSASPEGTSSIYSRAGQARGSRENGLWEFVASAERFSTPRSGKRGCSGAGSYYEPLPIAKASFARAASSHPSRGFAKDVKVESSGPSSPGRPAADGRSWDTRGSPCPKDTGQVKSTSRCLPTTGVLPLRKEWEGDEEFLSLPPRLRELERLAQFLSNLSLTIRMPGHDHQNLPHHSASKQPLSSRLAPLGEVRGGDDGGNTEGYAGLWQHRSSRKPSWENTESDGWFHRDPPRGLHLPAALRDTLDGMCLKEPRVKGRPQKSQQSESLIQCVQMFCCQLEELIRWLYTVVDVTGGWVPPSPDARSVSASLRRYLEFRRDVADHRSLTESVLERGEALLDCMASNSPALKDTLGLIAKQSEELENHAEHLYKSILAAVGAVGQDKAGAAHGCSLGAASVRPRLR